MMEIQPLHRDLIHRYLEETGDDFEVDEDGNFVVEYDRDPDSGCELTGFFGIESEYVYVIELADERDFPRADWDRLLAICNEWNNTDYYPNAYLQHDEENAEVADVRLEHCILLKSGVTQQQLTDATGEIVDQAFAFWAWVHREYGI